ncbi:MAG TPA: sugar ABC transporter permease [Candidatus Limiplasma pullistercoris]|mgnify:FL=1|nr:sugar ABC transporter permease [Candidatus Limiplasma pullistercoris]
MKQRFWKRHGFAYLAISPFFIQFLIFQLVPTIATFYYSFTNWNGMKEPRWIGWSNYAMMLEDYQFIDSLRNTALYWVVGVMGVLCLSLMIASLLNSQALRFKSFFKTVTFLPYVCASMAMGLIFGMLFDENAGLINAIIESFGGQALPWLTSSKLARIPVHILFIWRTIPWYTLIFLSGLLNIPTEYYEAATVDGASGAQKFFRITLPQLSNISFFCFVTITVDAWKIFNEPYTLAGPGSSNTSLFQLMYTNAFKIFKMGYASALGVVLILVLLIISLIQFRVRRAQGEI